MLPWSHALVNSLFAVSCPQLCLIVCVLPEGGAGYRVLQVTDR